MRNLTGWLILVEEKEASRAVKEGILRSGAIPIPTEVKEEEEAFLGVPEGESFKLTGLFLISSIGEDGIKLKPQIILTEKLAHFKAREIAKLGEKAEKIFLALERDEYERLREAMERLGMEESLGSGLTIPG